ncbi:MAG: twin-arginine translocase TatA/TatE family subunit [Chloroflexota bacterium]
MPSIGWPELVVLLVVVLIIFGPGKLPDIGNAIGRGVREFRKASNDLESSIRGETKKPPTAETVETVETAEPK